MLDHPRIRVQINKKFHPDLAGEQDFDHIFYTGPIDAFFNFDEGRLGYRTLRFEKEVCDGSFQGCTQVNYTDEEILFTRITEFKYFTPWKRFDRTVIMREFSHEARNGDSLYYPKRLNADKAILDSYIKKANQLQGVSFLGRLGTYRYLDMQHVIAEAIDFAADVARNLKEGMKVPVFPAGAIT